jgi:hypothetical protein
MTVFAFTQSSITKHFNGFHIPYIESHMKELLLEFFGLNVPSWVYATKSHVLIDHSLLNWCDKNEQVREFGHISNHCLGKWGVDGFFYDSEKVCKALASLTFLHKVSATPWNNDRDHEMFFAINRKKLKKWFMQNHNRFLLKLTPEHKQYILRMKNHGNR